MSLPFLQTADPIVMAGSFTTAGAAGGVVIPSGTPTPTTNTLYNNSSILTWNGTPIDLTTRSSKTGFDSTTTTTLTFSTATRIVTLAPTGANFDVFVSGTKYTKTSQTSTIPNTTGAYYVYFDNTGTLQQSTSPWDILTTAPIAYVYWDSGLADGFAFEERHGASWAPSVHKYLHLVNGTEIISGFAASGYNLAGAGGNATNAFNTFALEAGVIADEDINFTTSALSDGVAYTIFNRTGATGTWTWTKTNTVPYKVGTTFPQYNQWTGATWQLTEGISLRYYNYFVFAAPSIDAAFQIILIPGQAQHTSLAAAQTETYASLSYGTLPFQEIAPLYQITLRTGTGVAYSGASGSCRIEAFARIVGSKFSISNFQPGAHDSLTGISGGAAGDYQHLTTAQWTIATQAATTSLSGYLSSTDWNTFNGKLSSLTGSGASITANTIPKNALVNMTAAGLLGASAAGAVGEIVLGTNLSFSGSTLNAAGGGSSTDDTSTNATYYPLVATTAGGSTFQTSSTKLTFNPSTAALTTTGKIRSYSLEALSNSGSCIANLVSTGSSAFFASGVTYGTGAWVHQNSTAYSCILGLDASGNAGIGATWYASSNNSVSWNLASAVPLWDQAGNWVSGIATSALTNAALSDALLCYDDGGSWLTSAGITRPRAGRSTGSIPSAYKHTLTTEFKTVAAAGVSTPYGGYVGLLTYAPYDGLTSSTGDPSYQLAFFSTAASGTTPRLTYRSGIDSTWNSWQEVYTSANAISIPASQGVTIASGAPGTTTNALYNVSGALYFNGSPVGGSAGMGYAAVADAAYTITGTDDKYVNYTSISTTRIVTLPAASTMTGKIIWVADHSGSVTSAIKITVTCAGTDKIQGTVITSIDIATPYGRLGLMSDGTKWVVLSRVRKVYRWHFDGALATTNKQPYFTVPGSARIMAVRHMPQTAGTGTMVIKVAGSDTYTITASAGNSITAYTSDSTTETAVAAGALLHCRCSTGGTEADVTVEIDVDEFTV